jgi:hypothetical protein
VKLLFSKHATKRDGEVAVYRRWRSKCKRYAVEQSKSKYGMPTLYRAIDAAGDIISVHRARSAAMRACQRHSSDATRPRRKQGAK